MRTALWLVVAIMVAGCGTTGESTPRDAPSTSPTPELPDGFRWESYGAVQVAVPDGWGWESGSQRVGQWCLGIDAGPSGPGVGRPGFSTQVGCPTDDPRETSVDATGELVVFTHAGDPAARTEGDRVALEFDEARLIVQAEAELRDRIVASAYRIETDHLGCPVSPPLVDDADWIPDTEFPTEPSGVTRLVACGYTAGGGGRGPGLTGSIELDSDVVRAIQRAPEGSGPNDPSSCLSTGDVRQVIVLRAGSGDGSTEELVVRYDDCRDAGFHDARGVRQLTPESVAAVFSGPLLPDRYSGHHQHLFADLLDQRHGR